MKIIIMERNTVDRALPDTALAVEGENFKEIVEALQVQSPFMGSSPEEYMQQVLQKLNFEINFTGNLENQCKQFVRGLARRGLIGFLVENKNAIQPKRMWEAILLIRDSGETNMFDYPKVAELMATRGYETESQWVLNHRVQYMELVFGGRVELIEGLPSDEDRK